MTTTRLRKIASETTWSSVVLDAAEKKSDSSMMGTISAMAAAVMTSWPNSVAALSRILQQRQQQASGRRHEDDRQQQRLGRLSGQPEGEGGEQAEPGRNGERQTSQPRERLAKPLDINLEPGQEQQHAEAKIAQDLHRRVHAHPVENRRADHDPGDYLEHCARHR